MAGGKKPKKRSRKTSSQSTSPSQSQLLKKFKNQVVDTSDGESEYQDAEDPYSSDSDIQSVSGLNMAVSGDETMLTKALIKAFENPTVVTRLITALREEIHSTFKGELHALKQKIRERDDRIQTLEAKVEGLEMYGRRNGVRIHGVPETEGENTDTIVMEIAGEIEAGIPASALGRSHRVGKKSAGSDTCHYR